MVVQNFFHFITQSRNNSNWTRCLLDSLPTVGSFRLLDTSPYWSFRLLDISPTAWTVCLKIAHFAYKTARIKSDV